MTPAPSFTSLPPELHLLIASHLPFPASIYLKQTNTYFNALLPSPSHATLLQAETTWFAYTHDLFACRYCLRLRPSSHFADGMLRSRRGRGGRNARNRFCVDCGVLPRGEGEARYGAGDKIVVCGVRGVVCVVCRELRWGGGVEEKGMCRECFVKKRLKEREEKEREKAKETAEEEMGRWDLGREVRVNQAWNGSYGELILSGPLD